MPFKSRPSFRNLHIEFDSKSTATMFMNKVGRPQINRMIYVLGPDERQIGHWPKWESFTAHQQW